MQEDGTGTSHQDMSSSAATIAKTVSIRASGVLFQPIRSLASCLENFQAPLSLHLHHLATSSLTSLFPPASLLLIFGLRRSVAKPSQQTGIMGKHFFCCLLLIPASHVKTF